MKRFGLTLFFAGTAVVRAATLTDVPLSSLTITDSVMTAKYRLAHTNFDQSIDEGSGTTTISGNNTFISANLGGVTGGATPLRNALYDFEIRHIAGEGFIFSMTRSGAATSSILSWGTFTTPIGGTSVTAMATGATPGDPFNIFHITARAERGASYASEYIEFINLTFHSPLTEVGFTNSQKAVQGAPVDRWLYSSTDLSTIDWKVTGQLRGDRDAGAGGLETVKFEFTAKAGSLVVPEPSTYALIGSALIGLGALARRRK